MQVGIPWTTFRGFELGGKGVTSRTMWENTEKEMVTLIKRTTSSKSRNDPVFVQKLNQTLEGSQMNNYSFQVLAFVELSSPST